MLAEHRLRAPLPEKRLDVVAARLETAVRTAQRGLRVVIFKVRCGQILVARPEQVLREAAVLLRWRSCELFERVNALRNETRKAGEGARVSAPQRRVAASSAVTRQRGRTSLYSAIAASISPALKAAFPRAFRSAAPPKLVASIRSALFLFYES